MKEQLLVRTIIEYLRCKGHTVWRQNSGTVRTGKNNSQFVRLAPPGTPDIIGFHGKTGRFIGIECKVGSNKPTQWQKEFGQNIQAAGGIYILAYTIDDIINSTMV